MCTYIGPHWPTPGVTYLSLDSCPSGSPGHCLDAPGAQDKCPALFTAAEPYRVVAKGQVWVEKSVPERVGDAGGDQDLQTVWWRAPQSLFPRPTRSTPNLNYGVLERRKEGAYFEHF